MDIQKIKEYNKECNLYKKKASDLQAEINYCKNALNDLCKSLTEQLGVVVNPDNLKQIYEEREAKTNNTILSGRAIMENIRKAERGEKVENKEEVQAENKEVQAGVQAEVKSEVQAEKVEILKNPVNGFYGFGGLSEVVEDDMEIVVESSSEISGVGTGVSGVGTIDLDSVADDKPHVDIPKFESPFDGVSEKKPNLQGFRSPFDDDDNDSSVSQLPKSDYKMPASFMEMATNMGNTGMGSGFSTESKNVEQI